PLPGVDAGAAAVPGALSVALRHCRPGRRDRHGWLSLGSAATPPSPADRAGSSRRPSRDRIVDRPLPFALGTTDPCLPAVGVATPGTAWIHSLRSSLASGRVLGFRGCAVARSGRLGAGRGRTVLARLSPALADFPRLAESTDRAVLVVLVHWRNT